MMYFNFLILFIIVTSTINSQDPREQSHSINVLPFTESNFQKYYVTWASSSGSNNGWQHDIYNQIISFSNDSEIVLQSDKNLFIGTGDDEAQEPVNVAINRNYNTILSVWEDGSGSSVDIRGLLHKPNGTVIRENWIIAGGDHSQHSPDVAHLKNVYLVCYTDEAPPATTSMNEVVILNDVTGERINQFDLSNKSEDNWWPVIASNESTHALICWGNGGELFASIIKRKNDSFNVSQSNFYISSIDQYYYSIAWLNNISKYIMIAKVNNNSVACLIGTNGVRTNFTTLNNIPICREVELAVRWNHEVNKYIIVFPFDLTGIAALSVSEKEITTRKIIPTYFSDIIWSTTGIACTFFSQDDSDNYYSNVLFAFNKNISNDIEYRIFTDKPVSKVKRNSKLPDNNKIILFPSFPNPSNPSVNISFFTSNEETVDINIYSINGELVKKLMTQQVVNGHSEIKWNGRDVINNQVSSGVYIVRLLSKSIQLSNKILLIK